MSGLIMMLRLLYSLRITITFQMRCQLLFTTQIYSHDSTYEYLMNFKNTIFYFRPSRCIYLSQHAYIWLVISLALHDERNVSGLMFFLKMEFRRIGTATQFWTSHISYTAKTRSSTSPLLFLTKIRSVLCGWWNKLGLVFLTKVTKM
jgi:hypothetical protein